MENNYWRIDYMSENDFIDFLNMINHNINDINIIDNKRFHDDFKSLQELQDAGYKVTENNRTMIEELQKKVDGALERGEEWKERLEKLESGLRPRATPTPTFVKGVTDESDESPPVKGDHVHHVGINVGEEDVVMGHTSGKMCPDCGRPLFSYGDLVKDACPACSIIGGYNKKKPHAWQCSNCGNINEKGNLDCECEGKKPDLTCALCHVEFKTEDEWRDHTLNVMCKKPPAPNDLLYFPQTITVEEWSEILGDGKAGVSNLTEGFKSIERLSKIDLKSLFTREDAVIHKEIVPPSPIPQVKASPTFIKNVEEALSPIPPEPYTDAWEFIDDIQRKEIKVRAWGRVVVKSFNSLVDRVEGLRKELAEAKASDHSRLIFTQEIYQITETPAGSAKNVCFNNIKKYKAEIEELKVHDCRNNPCQYDDLCAEIEGLKAQLKRERGETEGVSTKEKGENDDKKT